MQSDDVAKYIDAWEEKTKKTRKGEDAKDAVTDTAQCLRSVAEFKPTLGEAIAFLRDAVDRKGNIMLSTVHKSKGLEYDAVSILDVDLIKATGQDPNVRYVAETRARHILNYITSGGYTTSLREDEVEQDDVIVVRTDGDVEVNPLDVFVDHTVTLDGDADSYPMPLNGWTCFHCGENFTAYGLARDHFGIGPRTGLRARSR